MLPLLQQLLTDLARTPSLVCTVNCDGAVSELFLDGAPQKVEFSDSWAAVEFKGWHIHAALLHEGFSGQTSPILDTVYAASR
jgi:hypothetical protein